MRLSRSIIAFAIIAIVLPQPATLAGPRPKKQEQAAPAPAPGDKRDRVVNAPSSPFNGRPFWQATAQCGGIYFKLNSSHSEAAISAKVIRPDPTAYTKHSKDAEVASIAATAFFDASERFLVADRKLARDEATLIYDAVANTAGERVKSIDAAIQAAKPCPELYLLCRSAFPQVCTDPAALTN
jgi:hypothetical protein